MEETFLYQEIRFNIVRALFVKFKFPSLSQEADAQTFRSVRNARG